MSHEAITAVLTKSKTKGSARALLLSIAYHIEEGTQCCQVTAALLGAESAIQQRNFRYVIRELEANGEVKVKRGCGRTVTHYTLLLLPWKPCKCFLNEPCQVATVSQGQTAPDPIRNSSPYRSWRKAVLKRDHYKCKLCLSNGDLNVHHIQPFAHHEALRFEVDNGITLCQSCHQEIKGRESLCAPELQALISPSANEGLA